MHLWSGQRMRRMLKRNYSKCQGSIGSGWNKAGSPMKMLQETIRTDKFTEELQFLQEGN